MHMEHPQYHNLKKICTCSFKYRLVDMFTGTSIISQRELLTFIILQGVGSRCIAGLTYVASVCLHISN